MTVDYGNPDRIEQITNAGNHSQTIIGPQGVVGAGSKPALTHFLMDKTTEQGSPRLLHDFKITRKMKAEKRQVKG